MKLSDCITEFHDTGICPINCDIAAKTWRKTTVISKYKEQYRLINRRAKVKITISKEDAVTLINKLHLFERKCIIFANASTFLKAT